MLLFYKYCMTENTGYIKWWYYFGEKFIFQATEDALKMSLVCFVILKPFFISFLPCSADSIPNKRTGGAAWEEYFMSWLLQGIGRGYDLLGPFLGIYYFYSSIYSYYSVYIWFMFTVQHKVYLVAALRLQWSTWFLLYKSVCTEWRLSFTKQLTNISSWEGWKVLIVLLPIGIKTCWHVH